MNARVSICSGRRLGDRVGTIRPGGLFEAEERLTHEHAAEETGSDDDDAHPALADEALDAIAPVDEIAYLLLRPAPAPR